MTREALEKCEVFWERPREVDVYMSLHSLLRRYQGKKFTKGQSINTSMAFG